MAKFWFPLALFLSWLAPTCAFLSPDTVVSFMNTKSYAVSPPSQLLQQRSPILARTQLNLFDKLFEEEGILGKGVTVGKVQIALNSADRGPNSIFGILEREANDDKSLPELTHAIALALLRKSDEWVGAAGTSNWFSQNDAGKAESRFNDLANAEAAKFEKVNHHSFENKEDNQKVKYLSYHVSNNG